MKKSSYIIVEFDIFDELKHLIRNVVLIFVLSYCYTDVMQNNTLLINVPNYVDTLYKFFPFSIEFLVNQKNSFNSQNTANKLLTFAIIASWVIDSMNLWIIFNWVVSECHFQQFLSRFSEIFKRLTEQINSLNVPHNFLSCSLNVVKYIQISPQPLIKLINKTK